VSVILAELVSRYSSSVAWKKQRYWMIVMNLDWVMELELSFKEMVPFPIAELIPLLYKCSQG
jgi:hypothetical protein